MLFIITLSIYWVISWLVRFFSILYIGQNINSQREDFLSREENQVCQVHCNKLSRYFSFKISLDRQSLSLPPSYIPRDLNNAMQ